MRSSVKEVRVTSDMISIRRAIPLPGGVSTAGLWCLATDEGEFILLLHNRSVDLKWRASPIYNLLPDQWLSQARDKKTAISAWIARTGVLRFSTDTRRELLMVIKSALDTHPLILKRETDPRSVDVMRG